MDLFLDFSQILLNIIRVGLRHHTATYFLRHHLAITFCKQSAAVHREEKKEAMDDLVKVNFYTCDIVASLLLQTRL